MGLNSLKLWVVKYEKEYEETRISSLGMVDRFPIQNTFKKMY